MKHITEDIAHGNVCKVYVAYVNLNSKSYISFSIKIGSRMSNTVSKRHADGYIKIIMS